MNKENNRSAAGLRRSAIAERLRLREEWIALKGVEENKQNKVLVKKPTNVRTNKPHLNKLVPKQNPRHNNIATSDALRGVVAYVDVGTETRALALRAALMALGASVVPGWSPLVTHLIWTQGGCHKIRSKSRALACQLVSPLWVEACAAEARRLPERLFPAPTRPSDLPSPATLRQLLKKAEYENISLADLLSESQDSDNSKPTRLRISSENESSCDQSRNKSGDKSANKSRNKTTDRSHEESSDHETTNETMESPSNIEHRVNTAPRRALPVTPTSPPQTKSRRKLFTHKEAELITNNEDTPTPAKPKSVKITPRGRKELARAERLAKKLVTSLSKHAPTSKHVRTYKYVPRIVLTGMSKRERHEISDAIHALNAKIQSSVNRRTTHVLLGSCREPTELNIATCNQCNKPEDNEDALLTANNNVIVGDHCHGGINVPNGFSVMCTKNISGVTVLPDSKFGFSRDKVNYENAQVVTSVANCISRQDIEEQCPVVRDGNVNADEEKSVMCSADTSNPKPRTVNALLGAARGCRVLYGKWALDSAKERRWLPHFNYEVPHLLKISQKARIERSALGRMRCEYAYDVFNGIKIHVQPNAFQKPAIIQLLTLCGAAIHDDGHGDVTIGSEEGEISSKWVFDSVAVGRMRTTRRYVNKNIPSDVVN